MEKETKILIGAGALAVAYYLYNVNKAKAAAAVSPIGKATMPPITTPVSPVATTSVSPVSTTPVGQLYVPPPSPSLKDAIKELGLPEKISPLPIGDTSGVYDRAGTGASIIAAKKSAQEKADRLAEIQTYEEESARQQAINLANQKAYQDYYLAEQAKLEKIDGEVLSAMKKEQARREAENAEREKAMNAFMYPTCPDGFEWFRNNCTPSYIVVEQKAISGEGLVLRDMYDGKVSLVQSCPAEYVKQSINCIPRSALSAQQLQVMAMEEAGMVQTSDGQWYLDTKSAATAQAMIDASKAMPKYTERQRSVNDAICSINRDGFINNPYSSATNGMSLSQYIGQFKVTANELAIARASCPNSVYSSNMIFGGRADDISLGYKQYYQTADIANTEAEFERLYAIDPLEPQYDETSNIAAARAAYETASANRVKEGSIDMKQDPYLTGNLFNWQLF